MANWVYGHMEIKGPIDNLLNFLNNGLQHMHSHNETPKPHEFIINDDGEIDTHDECETTMYIVGSSRHFVTIDLDEISYDHDRKMAYASFSTEIAWGLDKEVFERISQYGLYVSTFGDEWGMMFAQSFIFDNGKLIKDSYRRLTGEDYEEEYPDEEWDWEEAK